MMQETIDVKTRVTNVENLVIFLWSAGPKGNKRPGNHKNNNTEEYRGSNLSYVETERGEKDNSLQDPEDLPLYIVGRLAMPPIKVVDNVLLEKELHRGNQHDNL